MKEILVATHNPGKVFEYSELLADLDVKWLSLDDVGITLDVQENGSSYEENAMLKVRAYVEASKMLTLADDSGIEVDALNGEPGIYSARYGGVKGSTQHKFLLDKLEGVPMEERTARFRCLTLLAEPGGVIHKGEGIVEGRITLEPVGDKGFGYDPLFYLDEYQATMAQLGSEIKNQISHRARALQALRPTLEEILE
ncbi:MAG: RdgB/HAM1 family non-canonical purine NTP pyrophosphatase [Chloroflexi bacterium]|nr:MAG: RdgB/HAM1 family non-canonical purine NTP pyrophosphatase [Chloroflexota bacterium]